MLVLYIVCVYLALLYVFVNKLEWINKFMLLPNCDLRVELNGTKVSFRLLDIYSGIARDNKSSNNYTKKVNIVLILIINVIMFK